MCAATVAGCSVLFSVTDYDVGPAVDEPDGSDALDGMASDDDALDGMASDGATASAYARAVMADAPRAYLRLGESSGSRAADVLGRTPGTYQDVGLSFPGAIVGDPDTAVHLENPKAGIILGDVLDLIGTAPFAIEVWAKPDVVDAVPRRIVTKVTTPSAGKVGDGYSIAHESSSSPLTFAAWTAGSGGGKAVTKAPLAAGVYSHIVVSYDGVTLRIFVDGDEATSNPVALTMVDNPARLVLGSLSSADGNTWRGELDEFAFYDHDLPAARVKAHHEIGRGRRSE